MADNSFRANRGRDDIDANSPDSVRDPLAELARLIGQTDTAGDYRTSARREPVQHYEDDVAPVASAQEWAAEDRYDDQHQYAEESYAEAQAAEAHPALRDDYPRFSQEEAREQHFDNRYREPAAEHDTRNAPLAYDDQYQDEPPPVPRSRQLPALVPEAHDVGAYEPEDGYADANDQGYQDDDGQWHEGTDDQGYAAEEYDETDVAPRRSGLALFLGVIGLVFIGAASAFAYHSMFGGKSFIPSLPPIIKASDSPNKIVPAQAASAGNPGMSAANTAEKLVPREEQPVPIQPQNAPPRVVATIPVVPQSATLPAAQSANGAQGQSVFPTPPGAAAPAPPAAAGTAEPKKIHTVTIRTNQPPPANIDPAAQSAPAAHAPAPIAPRAAAPVPRPSANAPLSLVPGSQSSTAPAPRTQVARAEPANAPLATTPTAASSAPVGGGYSVQVTSQRSEADAESSYKELQAKYPGQLASHHASIRRADLGEKGTYYRAMVGPFASAESASSMCSSLKAAGGSCIVQRN
ncbi:MAG: SPOR domain-containing protein [Xanthobacteraceae bacterium]